ncbi:hypothetical protein DFP72DRAFT_1058223 [Ephemerocybe angulata]|uniref:Uncharacterized protein n=1 Tax=Ephemerocybe angulata TaxID=980116 RepID=A0A8H6IHP9_9AGAR|nr:hypothetical protein DFP72DRAFT_1058223 [Tulosesus angulatus]
MLRELREYTLRGTTPSGGHRLEVRSPTLLPVSRNKWTSIPHRSPPHFAIYYIISRDAVSRGEDDAIYGQGQEEEEQTSAIPEPSEDWDGDAEEKATHLALYQIRTPSSAPTPTQHRSRPPSLRISHNPQLLHPRPNSKCSQRARRRFKSKKTSSSASKDTRDKLERKRLHLERLNQQGVLPKMREARSSRGSRVAGAWFRLLHSDDRRALVRRVEVEVGVEARAVLGVVVGAGVKVQEEFGDFVDVPRDSVPSVPQDDEDAVDLGAGMYAGSGRKIYAGKSVVSDERSPF